MALSGWGYIPERNSDVLDLVSNGQFFLPPVPVIAFLPWPVSHSTAQDKKNPD